jgi:hypothetical protein
VATNLLRHGDAYDGAAIVKSNYNFGGIPEARLAGQPRPVVDQYRVYARFRDVPAALFAREDLVVQKFEAERDGALYCVRYLAVMGRYRHCIRLRSRSHLVKGDNYLPDVEAIDPHPEILAAREKLGLDYGKMDYVVVDGRAILLDVNKTVGIGMMSDDPKMRKLRRERASALYGYFE